MHTNLVTIDQTGAPAGLLAATSLATIDQPKKRSPIIGFNTAGGGVVGLGGISQLALRNVTRRDDITWGGIAKVSAATLAAGAVVGVRAASLAVDAGKLAVDSAGFSREQMLEKLALMQAQRDAAVRRAVEAEARASRKATRWSDAERARLATFFTEAKHKPYAAIAADMAATFGRAFTAASVGSQARKLGLVAKAPARPTKAAQPPRRRSRKAV
jgi:hypothetical protein